MSKLPFVVSLSNHEHESATDRPFDKLRANGIYALSPSNSSSLSDLADDLALK